MTTGVETLSPMQYARKVTLLVLTLAAMALVTLVATPPAWRFFHERMENLGLLAILMCIAGRCWCTLYIGGRKGAELVDIGPYSLCRNPLYFFSFVGAFGVGAQTGSLTIAVIMTVIAWAVFRVVVGREEAFLKGALGEPYARYLVRVPRFLPNPSLWHGAEVLEVRPRRVVLTFFDGLFFLAAIPLAEGLEWLQNDGLVPVLMHLP
jgi:protein-S-isoprenylcysteine O-methyltransferase Ste14